MAQNNPLAAELPAEASFGDLLRHFRRRAGLTQEDLAERANVSARAVSDLERGAKQGPHRTTVALLAGALFLTAEERALLERSTRRSRGPLRATGAERTISLPEPPTSLVGRRRDVEEAVHRIRWGGVRLLTLTGPGGVGKTRVAVAATTALRNDCSGGPTYVSLAALRDVRLVGPTIAKALGMRDTGAGSSEEMLLAHLQQRDSILVLDNLEHLTEAAGLISSLLQGCPRLRLVVTSRIALKLQGEHRMEIAPLEVPGQDVRGHADAAARYPAVELFAQRAVAARRDFALTEATLPSVIEICRRLDGLPLAIELAAARTAHLTVQGLLMRLSRSLPLLTDGPADLPSRQQTMRDTIAWSYELLDEDERRVLRHLSVFAGGWVLDAAEAVCEQGEGRPLFADLSALIDKSLVLIDDGHPEGEPRYRMLETIREFAGDELASYKEEGAARARHARYYLALAEEAEPYLAGPDQVQWLERLEIEHDNLRVALEYGRTAADADLGMRLGAGLWRFWLSHGHIEEGGVELHSLLSRLDEASSPLLQARVLYAAGAMAYGQARHDEAGRHFESSLALYRMLGDTAQIAVVLNGLGIIAMSTGKYEHALSLLRESAAMHRASGNDALLAAPLMNMANIVRYQGRDALAMAEAAALYEECIAIYRRMGNLVALANALNNLALHVADAGDRQRAIDLANQSLDVGKEIDSPQHQAAALHTLVAIFLDEGDEERAWPLAEESLDLFRRSGDRDMVATALVNLGMLEFRRGRHDRAEELTHEAHALLQQTGARRILSYVFESLGDIARVRGDLRGARAWYDQALSVCTEVGYVLGIASALEHLAGLACAEGSWGLAAQQYAMAATLRERINVPVAPVVRAEIARDLAHLREMLGTEDFEAVWQEGARAAGTAVAAGSHDHVR